jgi:hypothetical protein
MFTAFALMMEATSTSATSVSFQQNTKRTANVPENS